MRKFSINRTIKSQEPTQEQIDRFKDFKRLNHDYELLTKRGKPIYKNSKLYLLITLIAIIILLLFLEE